MNEDLCMWCDEPIVLEREVYEDGSEALVWYHGTQEVIDDDRCPPDLGTFASPPYPKIDL